MDVNNEPAVPVDNSVADAIEEAMEEAQQNQSDADEAPLIDIVNQKKAEMKKQQMLDDEIANFTQEFENMKIDPLAALKLFVKTVALSKFVMKNQPDLVLGTVAPVIFRSPSESGCMFRYCDCGPASRDKSKHKWETMRKHYRTNCMVNAMINEGIITNAKAKTKSRKASAGWITADEADEFFSQLHELFELVRTPVSASAIVTVQSVLGAAVQEIKQAISDGTTAVSKQIHEELGPLALAAKSIADGQTAIASTQKHILDAQNNLNMYFNNNKGNKDN